MENKEMYKLLIASEGFEEILNEILGELSAYYEVIEEHEYIEEISTTEDGILCKIYFNSTIHGVPLYACAEISFTKNIEYETFDYKILKHEIIETKNTLDD